MTDVRQLFINDSQQVSTGARITNALIAGLYTDPNMSGNSITFQTSQDGVGYALVGDGSGGVLTVNFTQGTYVPLNPQDFAGAEWIRVVSNASEDGVKIGLATQT